MTSFAHPPDRQEPALTTPDPRSHLLDHTSLDTYRQGVADGVERVARRIGAVDGPVTGVTAAELQEVVAGIDLDRPLPADAALDELDAIYLRDAVYFHHPRYLAHLNRPVVIPALVAEAVLAAVNSSLDTVDQSMGATVIEQRLISGFDAAEYRNSPSARSSTPRGRSATTSRRRCRC